MRPVSVVIFHQPPRRYAGRLEKALATARARVAERHFGAFLATGATSVEVISGDDDRPFGRRLARLARSGALGSGGTVVLGAGAVPLARSSDRRSFVELAAADGDRALANNRYSADIIAISRADVLRALPDLPGDNALPRWLAEHAGLAVSDLRGRWRLAVDLDSPLDVELLSFSSDTRWLGALEEDLAGGVRERLARVQAVMRDSHGELLVAGRTSAASLAWLERHAACRIRALVEERGLRAGSPLAGSTGATVPRPPRSILGALLDRTGPAALGDVLTELGDAALVDTRVLMAHRLGADERAWPSAEDRYGSDLLLADDIADPWLRAITESALGARIPIVLGGHSLVGPGVRLVGHPGR